MKLDGISPEAIENLIHEMKEGNNAKNKHYAPATIKRQLALLSKLYSIAYKWNLYDKGNPCKKVEQLTINNEITEHLNDDELSRLLIVLDEWENKMSSSFILFLLYTGLRRGELFKLKWSDIDFERQTILLREPKGKKNITLPLSDKAIDVLKNVPKEFKTEWVFYGKNGGQRTDFKKPWLRIRKKAQIPEKFRLHGLRHHFASSLVNAGVDLYTVQKLLTHKDASTTQRYASLSDKTLKDAVNLSDKLQTINPPAKVIPMEVSR